MTTLKYTLLMNFLYSITFKKYLPQFPYLQLLYTQKLVPEMTASNQRQTKLVYILHLFQRQTALIFLSS